MKWKERNKGVKGVCEGVFLVPDGGIQTGQGSENRMGVLDSEKMDRLVNCAR